MQQLCLNDYLAPDQRVMELTEDRRRGAKGERWDTARLALLAAPIVTEDPDGHTAISDAVDEYLRLDLHQTHDRLIGQEVSWTRTHTSDSEGNEGEQIKVKFTGIVRHCLQPKADACQLLKADQLTAKANPKRGTFYGSRHGIAMRYLIEVDGVMYAIGAHRINRANVKKLLQVPEQKNQNNEVNR